MFDHFHSSDIRKFQLRGLSIHRMMHNTSHRKRANPGGNAACATGKTCLIFTITFFFFSFQSYTMHFHYALMLFGYNPETNLISDFLAARNMAIMQSCRFLQNSSPNGLIPSKWTSIVARI